MKQTRSLILLCLCLLALAALPAAAQEAPLGVPLSPEQESTLPDAIRSDPRAIYGAIHITGFDQLGCSNFAPVARVTILVPSTHEGFVIRSTVSRMGLMSMNERMTFNDTSGAYPWVLGNFTSGGPVNASWPLTADVGYTLSMLLIKSSGEPLWYTEANFSCNGAPSFVETMSTPVRVLSLNSEFNKAGSTSTLAAKWKPTGNAKRTCTALPTGCAIKMTAKPGKTTQITQNKRFRPKPGAGSGSVFGMIVMYEAKSNGFVPGEFDLALTINGGGRNRGAGDAGGMTATFNHPVTVPNANGEFFTGMKVDTRLTAELEKLNINLAYSADAKNAIFVRSAYFWVADRSIGGN